MQELDLKITERQRVQLALIAQLFPFHFFLDHQYAIIQMGNSLKKLIPERYLYQQFNTVFKIKQPVFVPSLDEADSFARDIFVLECLIVDELQIRGQLLKLPDTNMTLFVGAPFVRESSMIKTLGININDFAIFDTLPDYLFALQAQETSMKEANTLAEQLNKQATELEEYNQQLKSFTYIASHDLKTPIRNIINFSQLLNAQSGKDLDEMGQKYIDFIIDSGKRMESLLNSLLQYSTTNKSTPNYTQVDLNKTLKNVLNDLQTQIKANESNITFPNLPTINADEQQLYQVFQNLLTNAIKFRGDKKPIITILHEEKTNFHHFEVIDNGIGISEKAASKVFIVFKRLHHEKEYEGTGIGLSICKKIIEKHQGNIWVKPNPEGGSIFCFTIKKVL